MLVPQASFRKETSGAVAKSVGCFLRLQSRVNVTSTDLGSNLAAKLGQNDAIFKTETVET